MALASRDAVIRELVDADILRPVLNVGACPFCGAPRRRSYRRCSGCQRLGPKHAYALRTFEPIALCRDDDPFEALVREWKGYWHEHPLSHEARSRIRKMAAPLSAYLEAHSHALGLDRDVVATWVPSTSGVIPAAFAEAEAYGWFVPRHADVAGRPTGSARQRYKSGVARLELSADEWAVDCELVSGRDVIVLDDVFTTGASMHSFASALANAGANDVVGVALIRHIGGTVYAEALRWRRMDQPGLAWSPEDRLLGTWN